MRPALSWGASSHLAAGEALTRHLLARGYKRIAFAAAQLDPRTLQRLDGWRSAMSEAGLHTPTLEWLNPAPSSLQLGAVLFEQILGQSPAIEAIFDEVGPLTPIRLHGDCHLGNLLWAPTGPVFVDLDDCVNGPRIQDLWMLLSGDSAELLPQPQGRCVQQVRAADFDDHVPFPGLLGERIR